MEAAASVDDQPAPREDAAADSRRGPRAEALLRAGARPPRRRARSGSGRGAAHAVDRVTAAVALGSNLGDRHAHLRFAIGKLSRLLDEMRLSNIRETEPAGVAGPQPLFLNAGGFGFADVREAH